MNKRAVAQRFAHLAGSLFRLLPRRARFPVASRIALLLAPIVHRSAWYRRRPSLLDGPREETMRMVLRTLTRAGTPFDPRFVVRGGEDVPPSPIILISAHFLLNIAITRWMYDRSQPLTSVIGGPREPMFYFGTAVPLDLLYGGPSALLRIRRKLGEGRSVFIDIDDANPHDGWITVDAGGISRYVSPAIPRFAQRLGVPVVFCAVRVHRDGRLLVTFRNPSSGEAQVALAEFCEFFASEAAQIAR